LGKRPDPGQGLDAGSRGKRSGPRTRFRHRVKVSVFFAKCSEVKVKVNRNINNYNGHSVERIPSHLTRLGIEL